MDTNMSTQIGGIQLGFKLFNAGGTIKTLEEVEIACKTIDDLSLILIGSYTLESRIGNPAPNYYFNNETGASINSIGLTNGGLDYLKKHLKEMVKIAEDNGKFLGISVSDDSIEKNIQILHHASECGVMYFEVNTACGNVLKNDNRSKPIACYDKNIIENICEKISFAQIKTENSFLGIKVGVYENYSDIDDLSKIINASEFDGVVTTNTIKSIMFIDGKKAITPDNGFGGLGGTPLKYPALGQATKWKEVLNDTKQVIGVGGIWTGQDIMDMEHAGASAMQIATAYLEQGRGVFSNIWSQYYDLNN